jgi:menaquinone-9 beta-reductase
METFDVAIVGGGPAGSTCAAFCAAAGLRTIVLEREKFPREKVCGDCLNPACWPVLSRLNVAEQVRRLPHGILDRVEFIAISGQKVVVDLPSGDESEIAVKRSLFDNLLLRRARELGAEVHEESTVAGATQTASGVWKTQVGAFEYETRILVGADGRNSTIARLCNLLPRPARERVALQTHIHLPKNFGNRVVLQFLPEGYSGQAPVDENELNLCLVSKPTKIQALRSWAEQHFDLSPDLQWRTITPLTRAPVLSAHENLFFIGDAARVVEPFTGEGIYYALRSGELAADAIVRIVRGEDRQQAVPQFTSAHSAMYRGRLWINRLARAAVLSPQVASVVLRTARLNRGILRLLTNKITNKPL